jgi:hypothetical protein
LRSATLLFRRLLDSVVNQNFRAVPFELIRELHQLAFLEINQLCLLHARGPYLHMVQAHPTENPAEVGA